MTLEEFIIKHKCINASGLAADMWPELKTPQNNMQQKLKRMPSGKGVKRITQQDTVDALRILNKMANDIKKIQFKDDFIKEIKNIEKPKQKLSKEIIQEIIKRYPVETAKEIATRLGLNLLSLKFKINELIKMGVLNHKYKK